MFDSYVFEYWHLPLWVAAYGVWWMFWMWLSSFVKKP